MRRTFFRACLFTLLAIFLFSQVALMASRYEPAANPTKQSGEVAKIQAYHDEIDA